MPRWLYAFLVFGPIALAVDLLGGPELPVFILAALGIIPVSGLIGRATEDLAHHVGPKFGGLLNATFGNAAEMIIGIVAINAGLLDLVKASITGSIIGNLLLVLGMGFLLGGLKHGTLRFDPREAGRNSAMMLIAIASLLMPAAYWIADRSLRNEPAGEQAEVASDLHAHIGEVSVAVSIIMIIVYIAYVAFSFTKEGSATLHDEIAPHEDPMGDLKTWSIRLSVGVLVASTVATVVLAELLVGTVEHVAEDFNLSELFVGVIVVPIIGNVAEHFSAVVFAYKNKPDISQAIAAGSSTQVALLVAPAFVLVSYALGNPMDLVFSPLEIIMIGMSGLLFAQISNDGESNWLEATELLGLYAIGAIVFFFVPF